MDGVWLSHAPDVFPRDPAPDLTGHPELHGRVQITLTVDGGVARRLELVSEPGRPCLGRMSWLGLRYFVEDALGLAFAPHYTCSSGGETFRIGFGAEVDGSRDRLSTTLFRAGALYALAGGRPDGAFSSEWCLAIFCTGHTPTAARVAACLVLRWYSAMEHSAHADSLLNMYGMCDRFKLGFAVCVTLALRVSGLFVGSLATCSPCRWVCRRRPSW
jgi:hypothetical protein